MVKTVYLVNVNYNALTTRLKTVGESKGKLEGLGWQIWQRRRQKVENAIEKGKTRKRKGKWTVTGIIIAKRGEKYNNKMHEE